MFELKQSKTQYLPNLYRVNKVFCSKKVKHHCNDKLAGIDYQVFMSMETYDSGIDEESWRAYANCLRVDPDLFYPERGASTKEAKMVCKFCVVREECLEYALEKNDKFGIWGGASERERRRMRRQRAIARAAASASVVAEVKEEAGDTNDEILDAEVVDIPSRPMTEQDEPNETSIILVPYSI